MREWMLASEPASLRDHLMGCEKGNRKKKHHGARNTVVVIRGRSIDIPHLLQFILPFLQLFFGFGCGCWIENHLFWIFSENGFPY
jgi:hypothetical protein